MIKKIDFMSMTPFTKAGNLEFYYHNIENAVIVSNLDNWNQRVLLFSPEGHYRFANIFIENVLVFLGLKDEPMSSFIYSLKTKEFLKNPENPNTYSFYPGFIKQGTFFTLNCKSYGNVHRKFCTLTHNFLSF